MLMASLPEEEAGFDYSPWWIQDMKKPWFLFNCKSVLGAANW
jgi:hypothetical protein